MQILLHRAREAIEENVVRGNVAVMLVVGPANDDWGGGEGERVSV